jgi:photosystem II stability/assembly factor-like uncharacterized protein
MRRLLLPIVLAGLFILAIMLIGRKEDHVSWPALSPEKESGPPPQELMQSRFGGEQAARTRPGGSEVSSTGFLSDWQALGPINMVDAGRDAPYEPSQGRMNSIAIDPANPQHLYAGAASGGVWVTTDGGTNWSPRAQGLPLITISSVVVDPTNGNVVFAATGDADGFVTPSVGVYKSTDGGSTWSATGLSFPIIPQNFIRKLAIDPGNGANLYAATSDGIYYTRNAGANWTRVLPTGLFDIHDVKLRPGNAATVYAVARGGRFLRSIDSGATWQAITSGLPDPNNISRAFLAVTAANSQAVFIMDGAVANTLDGIYRSTDGGNSFAPMPSDGAKAEFGSAAFYNMAIAVSPTSANEVYIGGFTVVRTPDGGATWLRVPGSQVPFFPGQTIVHVDIHDIQFLNGAVYVGSDGGLHRTTDGGTNWTNLSPTLNVGQIYSFSGSRQTPARIYVGEQDNGLNRFDGTKWEHTDAGDYGRVVVDPTNDQVVYGSANFALNKSTDGFTTNSQLNVTTENKRFEGAPLAINPANTQIVYAGYENLHRSTNGGATWQKLSNFTDGLTVDAIVLAPSDSKTIYLGRSQFGTGKFYRSTDEGATFVEITAGLPNPVTGVAVDPNNPARVWVSLQGGNTNAVFSSVNGGANWTNYSGTTLPNSSTRCIVYENGSQDGIYVGTVAGVYYRNASATDWQPFNVNLPNVVVSALEINYTSKKLRAGTYGRGLWQTDLATPIGVVANVSTRLFAGKDDNALFEGFIIQGPAGSTKKLLIRGLGPFLGNFQITGFLANPTLDIFQGSNRVAMNNDWRTTQIGGLITADQSQEIAGSGLAPTNEQESAIIANLPPGNFTAVVRGLGNTDGIALVDAFDLSAASLASVVNFATRGLVQPGDKLLTAGFIVQNGSVRAVIRAIGPSLTTQFNIANALPDTTLQLRDQNGGLVQENDDWQTDQKAELEATGLQPTNLKEAALVRTIPAGQYSAQVRGKPEQTGIGVVEIYFIQ